jgi:hypothetical protein
MNSYILRRSDARPNPGTITIEKLPYLFTVGASLPCLSLLMLPTQGSRSELHVLDTEFGEELSACISAVVAMLSNVETPATDKKYGQTRYDKVSSLDLRSFFTHGA